MAMGAAKIRGLLQWCKQQVEGYPGVEVTNFTKSFRDGLAFCAIIHRYRPELLDFYALSKENILENNQLAYSVAEGELGIPALLDAEDMVAVSVPDRLSVITYVSQYYNCFGNKTPMGGPNVVAAESSRISMRKRKQSSATSSTATPSEAHGHELCAICHKTVYMLERHHLDDQLVHRSCLRRNQMKDIGDRVKSLERGAHLKRNLCSSNANSSNKESEGENEEKAEEGVSASKRRTSPSRTSAVVQPKAPEPTIRTNGTARHQPNNFVGQPSPVIPPLSEVPSSPSVSPAPRETTPTPPLRTLSPPEGKPVFRPRSPTVPVPSNLSQTPNENISHPEATEKSTPEVPILRSRSPTPRTTSSTHKSETASQISHHKRRAPAPPRAPSSSATAPPRPPSIRTLPTEMPSNRVNIQSQVESEQDSYPESLNPFCDATAPSGALPTSVSNDSLKKPADSTLPAKFVTSSPKVVVRRPKEERPAVKEQAPATDQQEKDVSFEYRGKNPFESDGDDDATESEQRVTPPRPPAPTIVPPAPTTQLPASSGKNDNGDVSFEYRGKNPFEMDSDDDAGSHDLSSTSGSSLRTSVMRKKRHAPPPPPPPSRPSNPSVPTTDQNGSFNRPGKDDGASPSPAPEPLTSEISPSSTNSGNDMSLNEAAACEPSGRKRITVMPEEEDEPTVPNVRNLRPVRPLDNFHFSSDENEGDAESASPNEPSIPAPASEAVLGDTDQETGSTHTNDSGPVRKGPAPAQPVVGRRCVRTDADEEFVPYADLIAELERLNEEQVHLEQKGRQLEEDLRNSEKRVPAGNDDAETAVSDAKVDSLMVSWLELIEQKNQLFRRESELHYRIRQRELEERHADIEFELRQLLAKQEQLKTPGDRMREEVLLQDLQACVMERAELVYALDEDQQRNYEDDKHRTRVLGPKFTNVLCLSSKSKKKIKDGKKKEKKEKRKEKKEEKEKRKA